MRKIVLPLFAAMIAVTPAFAWQQRPQQRFVPPQHFVVPQPQQQIHPRFVRPYMQGDGGYVIQQPTQVYCYDTVTGNFLHWGACYGTPADYGVYGAEE